MNAKFATTKKTVIRSPAPDTTCYACDAVSAGCAMDRNAGKLVYACKRHSDPTLKVTDCCIYCGDPTRRGSLSVGEGYAHHKCHADACRD